MKHGVARIVAFLSVVPLVHVGAASAAMDLSAGSVAAVQDRVVIRCEGKMRNGPPGPAHGRCAITGAITDRGRFLDSETLYVNPHVRTVFGRKGTIRISVYRKNGYWRIIGGTRTYFGLHGRGWESSSGPCHLPSCPSPSPCPEGSGG
jgi:hypothetical protein